MTLSEFKAWFEGYTENLDGPPSPEQWERIKSKIKEIREASPRIEYIDRPSRPRYPRTHPWLSFPKTTILEQDPNLWVRTKA